MQRLLCPREPALLLSRAELHSKGCWVSIQLIPGTLWQQGQEIDVSVPSPMPFLPQHPLLPPILHPLSIIPKVWEVEKGLSKGVASQLARGWSSCSFISQAWRFPPDALLEAAELSFLLSLAVPLWISVGKALSSICFSLRTHPALRSEESGEISCLPSMLTLHTAKVEPLLWF